MLTPMFKRSGSMMRRFCLRDDGSISVEALIMTPLLFFGLMASFAWYSAFKEKAEANKAAYTLSDYVSRQTTTLTPEFIEGMGKMYAFLSNDGDTSLRVSAVKWSTVNTDEGEYELVWSHATGNFVAHVDVLDFDHRLPLMGGGQEIIVVETERYWHAPFKINLDNVHFYDFVVSSPRYATQVPFDSGTDDLNDDGDDATDDGLPTGTLDG